MFNEGSYAICSNRRTTRLVASQVLTCLNSKMPNKKNKNQPKNAFYFYMVSLKPQLQRQGVVLENGMQSLAEIAGPRWKELPEHEKEVYQEMARQAKSNRQYGPPRNDRRDCTGQLLSQRVDAVSLNENKRRRQRDEVKLTWPPGKLVCDESFYLIGFMSLCEASDHVQLPCELGVAKFSINGGIIKSMHRFIKPGEIPLGYRFQCTNTSEKTHKIPLSGLAKEGDSYYNIFMDLLGFVNPDEGNNAFPPVYSRASEATQTELCLDWLAMSAGMPNRLKKVYELEGLICDLYEHITKGESSKISKAQATELISSTMFDYELGSRCDYHQTEEVKFCALGTVKRNCYCMADFLCPHYNITLTTKHMPERPEGSFGVVLNDTTDSYSKQYTEYDDEFTYPAYTQRPCFGRGYGNSDNQYSRSGPTYEGANPSSGASNASWYQRSLNEDEQVKQQLLLAPATNNSNSRFPVGRGRGRGRGVPSSNRPGPPGELLQTGPVAGRGRAVRIPNTKPKVYAGTANAPHPSAAPAPPLSWQQSPQQQEYYQQHQYRQQPYQYQHKYHQDQQQQNFHGYNGGQTNQLPWQQGQYASGSAVRGMNSIDDVMRMMSNVNMLSNQ